MGLFGKKNKNKVEEKDQNELSEEEKVGQKKLFKKKDFKDLNSKDKKARREPKKPWGRTERVWVFVVLASTVGISCYLWLTSVGWSFPKLSKVNWSLPNIFTEETIVIENEN